MLASIDGFVGRINNAHLATAMMTVPSKVLGHCGAGLVYAFCKKSGSKMMYCN
jgi:hypothetical protein